jgi:CRISPR system Cascade subunit CasE
MYLTRFRVNTGRLGARRLLGSPQALHAAVMTSFAEPLRNDDAGPRVLWRLDNTSAADTHLYIVSPDKPDLTHLVEQAGWPTTGGWDTYDYRPLLSRLRAGDRLAFRLTVNPVHSIRRKDGEPTKLTAHITPRHQLAWLLQRQQTAGFSLLEKTSSTPTVNDLDRYQVVLHNRRNLSFAKSRDTKRVTLTTVTFDGRLEITDADAFRRTLTRGLGRGKAYGCGLMTLAGA